MKKLTYEDRLQIAKFLKAGNMSERKLCVMYQTSKGTISRIRKDIVPLLENNRKINIPNEQFKVNSNSLNKFNDLNKMVYETFLKLRENDICVNGTVLKMIGKKVASKLSIKDFCASNGWLDRFKSRHNLLFKNICGETKSADKSSLDEFYSAYDEHVLEYGQRNIFNCDETALFIKNLPSKSFVEKSDSCKGAKQIKEKITLFLCCSLEGEKLEPLIIGKYKNPRCMKNFNLKDFRVLYFSSKNAWMTTEIFQTWLTMLNAEMIKQSRKIVLVLDNASCHKSLECSNVKLLFLPKNTTSLIQPLDMGIIKTFKTYYVNTLMNFFLNERESSNFLSKLNIRQAIVIISEAWEMLTVETIKNCWNKINEHRKSDLADIINDEVEENINEVIEETFENLDGIENIQFYNGEEITNDVEASDVLKQLEKLEENVRIISSDSLKEFYAFRKKLLNDIQKAREIKITDFFIKK